MLWFKSLGMGFTPRRLEYYIKYDTQMADGPIGMCGLVDGKLVAIVGMLTMPTRTKHGEIEKVGGICAIGTNPLYTRRGYARKLLIAAEEYFRDQGIKFAFLTTKKSLVAYKWYLDAGYKNVKTVEDYPYLYKILKKVSPGSRKAIDRKYRLNLKKAQDIFKWYVKDHCGFTERNMKDLKSRMLVNIYSKKLSLCTDNGYALISRNNESVIIKEILAKSQKTYLELIKLAEAQTDYGVAAFHPFDPKAQKAFTRAGYITEPGNFITLMCKPLDSYKFSDYYNDRFMISKVDWF